MANPNPLRRRLSLFGLLIILVAFMWLAVQAVQHFPQAASTLASLANSVYNYNPREVKDFTVTGPTTMVNSGDVFNLSWSKLSVPGQYSFSYSCTDGVTANLKSASQTFSEAACDTAYDIGETTQLELALSSNQARFVEVDYTVSFFRTNAVTPTALASGGITIINPTLSLSGELIPAEVTATSTPAVATSTPVVTPAEPTTPPREITVTTPPPPATSTPVVATTSPVTQATSSPATATTTKPATIAPRPTPTVTYTYAIPVSQPNGFTDLSVSYLGTGYFATNGQFVNTGLIQASTLGAIQFSVHNLGTRTSETWRYVAELPNGQTYTSPDQAPLKPNERATLTLGFPAVNDSTTLASFGVSIETSRDTNTTNNIFSWSTIIIR